MAVYSKGKNRRRYFWASGRISHRRVFDTIIFNDLVYAFLNESKYQAIKLGNVASLYLRIVRQVDESFVLKENLLAADFVFEIFVLQ